VLASQYLGAVLGQKNVIATDMAAPPSTWG
jgi:hypothetical protein